LIDKLIFEDALVDVYDDCMKKMFGTFVSELSSSRTMDEASRRFKSGVELANQAFEFAKNLWEG